MGSPVWSRYSRAASPDAPLPEARHAGSARDRAGHRPRADAGTGTGTEIDARTPPLGHTPDIGDVAGALRAFVVRTRHRGAGGNRFVGHWRPARPVGARGHRRRPGPGRCTGRSAVTGSPGRWRGYRARGRCAGDCDRRPDAWSRCAAGRRAVVAVPAQPPDAYARVRAGRSGIPRPGRPAGTTGGPAQPLGEIERTFISVKTVTNGELHHDEAGGPAMDERNSGPTADSNQHLPRQCG